MDESALKNPPPRKTWPMAWVVLAIVAYIVVYTVVNIGFRKSEPPYEPYVEAQERRQNRTIHSSMLGWSRLEAALAPPAAGSLSMQNLFSAAKESDPPELESVVPRDLMVITPGKPRLYPAAAEVLAPASLKSGDSLYLRLRFTEIGSLPAWGETLAYVRNNQLHVFVQDDSRTPPRWAPVAAAAEIDLLLESEGLAPGEWHATLYTRGATFRWDFAVE